MKQRPGLGIDQPPPVPFPDSAVLRTNTAVFADICRAYGRQLTHDV
jgi:hypothetical protein